MAGTLGVATFAYLPYCFFNLINPLIAAVYGFLQDRSCQPPGTDIAASFTQAASFNHSIAFRVTQIQHHRTLRAVPRRYRRVLNGPAGQRCT